MIRKTTKSIACLFVLIASVSIAALGQNMPEVLFQRSATMKTRDGVTLRADVYRPAGEGVYPVLLKRTPYDKDNDAALGRRMAARGYIVVIQDVRGRYASDGEWYPFKHEIEDGYDAVEWAAALPHSNGKVGMFSGSYVGATQMLAAIGHPPHLAGICPVVTASNYHENWTYQGGAFEQWFNESWTSGLAQNTLSRAVEKSTNAVTGSVVLPLTQYPLFNNLSAAPVGSTPLQMFAPYFLDWLAHPDYDSYWKQWSIEENFANIQVPSLTIAAWYDIFQGGSLRNYMGLRDHAGNSDARATQRLVVAVGGHAGWLEKVGDVDFGPTAPFDETDVTLEWYDYLFLGKQNRFADAAHPVHIFVMGKNEWRDEESWPPRQASKTPYPLTSGNHANSASGDGQLLDRMTVATNGKDTYIYDPANPVPTVGGPLCCDSAHLAPGPRDQKDVEARDDVMVYSTPPLKQDVEVTGPVTLDLYAASSAVDTDFTAKLVDVWPNGFAQNLTEGIIRARYRDSRSAPSPIVPGQIYEYTVDMWSTSNVFLKGHKIRLEISSSNFPRFDRNLNTGKSAAIDSTFEKATNTIYHDRDHPSALFLPVVSQ